MACTFGLAVGLHHFISLSNPVFLRQSIDNVRRRHVAVAAKPQRVSGLEQKLPNLPLLNTLAWPRSRSLSLKAQVDEEESVVAPDTGISNQSSNDRALEAALAPVESESSWLPAFPHVLTAAMANFMFGYHIGVMNGPLESIARELKFEGDTIMEGFVVSIFIVGAFLGSVIGGVLADKLGRRSTFQLDAIPLVLGAALSASAQSVNLMILGRFLVGIGIGVNTGLVPMYISEVAPTKFRGALGSMCQIGTCIGIISALLIGLPAETDPHWWRTMLWLATIPGVALMVGMQFAAESPRWLGQMGRWDEAENVIKNLWGEGEVEVAMEELRAASSNEGEDEDITWSELIQAPYFKVAAIGSALFALQQFAGINGVLYFSSLTFRDAGITNSVAASAAVGLANLIGAVVALSLMDNQGRRKLLMGSYAGMAFSMALLVAALEMPGNSDFAHILSVGGTLFLCLYLRLRSRTSHGIDHSGAVHNEITV